jgi:catechol 2,3-dioxygenase-like lactoylglutathione lyase family enzyme
MSSAPGSQQTFTSIVPRFVVSHLEQALAFYGQLGFRTSIYDEHFAFAERDEVTLHLQCYSDPPKGHSVCWIEVMNSEALYQQYLPTGAICAPLEAKPWRFKEFCVRDPFGNLLLFAERLSEADARSETGG